MLLILAFQLDLMGSVTSKANRPSSGHLGGWVPFPAISFSDLGLDQIKFEDDDVLLNGDGAQRPLLGKYTLARLEEISEQYGIRTELEARGISSAYVDMDTSDHFVHKLFFWYGIKGTTPKDKQHLLLEMFFRRVTSVENIRDSKQAPPETLTGATLRQMDESLQLSATRKLSLMQCGAPAVALLQRFSKPDFVVIEWTRMQNPMREDSSHGEKLLPGQEYPSLGIGHLMGNVLMSLASASHRDALVNCPLYFHTAVIYSKLGWRFVNPAVEGIFQTLLEDTRTEIVGRGLVWAAHAVVAGGLKARIHSMDASSGVKIAELHDQAGGDAADVVTVMWKGAAMMHPISDRARHYLKSDQYLSIFKAFKGSGVFSIAETNILTEEDWEKAVPLVNIDTRSQ